MPPAVILHVVSELYPFVKTGGLADVAAALPPELARVGWDVRLLIPGYPAILDAARSRELVWRDADLFGGGEAELFLADLEGTDTPAYVLDCPGHFRRRGGPYVDALGADYPDNHRRFAALGWAAAALGWELGPQTILHVHDWQGGLAVAYGKLNHPRPVTCVSTIHNIDYPGAFDAARFPELALPASAFSINGVEFFGRVSFLKAALYYADRITTVSPTYAREIQLDGRGGGFEGLLRGRRDGLTGILNGVDYTAWDPASDRHLPARYDAAHLRGKARCRGVLAETLSLDLAPETFVVGVVSRLIPQKGIDWLLEVIPWLVEHEGAVALLGSGDAVLEDGLRRVALRLPGRVGVRFGYDEALAHLIQAGCDSLAVPSRTEPCGLTQLYALRYGSPPIVRRTGGLTDTVVDASAQAISRKTATGFVFDEPNADHFRDAIDRAMQLRRRCEVWQGIQSTAMKQDFGWARSARAYGEIYGELSNAARPTGGSALMGR
jgi:starch synthase